MNFLNELFKDKWLPLSLPVDPKTYPLVPTTNLILDLVRDIDNKEKQEDIGLGDIKCVSHT